MTVKLKQALKFIIFNIVAVLLIIVLCEGLASLTIFVQELGDTKPVAERMHTRYDPEIGWVNIPNTRVDNLYAPGLHVHINEQGFRSSEDFTVDPPAGKTRFICSGDSFTFGYGVSNDQTWCHKLTTLDDRIQTVNMAQGGYGIDQAYLWYKRDGDILTHDIQLFAFITADFDRMRRSQFLGYGKPVLEVENNELVLDNVPVPRRAFYIPWATQHQGSLNELRTVQVLNQIFFDPQAEAAPKPKPDEEIIMRVSWQILQELANLNQERNSLPVLVYLPSQSAYKGGAVIKTDTRRRYVEQAAIETGLIYIDLIDEFRALSDQEMNDLFIPHGAIDFPGAAGHYTAKGNQYIAEQLYKKLLEQPEIITILEQRTKETSHSLPNN